MRKWTESIDPSTIPDSVLKSERARRNAAKRTTYGRNGGRPKKLARCQSCGGEFGVAEMRGHKCAAK